jgi:hypothetical protein
MRKQFLLVVWSTLVLMFAPRATFGQPPVNGLYCTSGLVSDGYIDFSGMPAAPVLPAFSTSTPITATLPVRGVAGLTVTVTIPSLTTSATPASAPLYSVNGGTLFLNVGANVNTSAPPTILLLSFNQAINGVGLDRESTGRFTYNYTLQVGATPSQGPVTFANSASGYTLDDYQPQAQNLQVVGLKTSFPTAAVLWAGDEYYTGISLSNIRVRSTAAPDPSKAVPTTGLQQWLRADTSTIYSTTWADQSGNGHDAQAGTGSPQLTVAGRNCQQAYAFAGNSSFNFNLPIAGWDQMTIFLVARADTDPPAGSYYSNNSAILWTENAFWGNTFLSPYQSHVTARFGTTQVGNNLSYARPGAGIGQDFTSTRAVHNGGVDTLYVNGQRVLSQSGKLSALGGVTGAGTIGEGFNHTFFKGEISEILVYNRVLSGDESAAVEHYLAQKYGLH